MIARLTRAVEGLVAVVFTVALLAGPPWLLITFVGPPIPASWPDLDTLRQIATVGVTDTFVITTLAVIIWIAWVQLALAIVAETAAAIRRRPPARLPLLPGTQPLAAKLVAGVLLLATLAQPRPLAAPLELATATTVTVVDADRPATAPGPSVAAVTPTMPTRTVTIGERDSWWSLAETHLGDGLRWRELRELNVGRTLADGTTITATTDQPPPGATLTVPATDDPQPSSGDDHRTDPTYDTDTDTTDEPTDAGTALLEDGWEVQSGDHFWHIADATLTEAWGRPPTDGEIAAYWHTLIETNRHRLAPPGNPDLIHPGQHFELPPVPADPTVPAATEPDGAPSDPKQDGDGAEPDETPAPDPPADATPGLLDLLPDTDRTEVPAADTGRADQPTGPPTPPTPAPPGMFAGEPGSGDSGSAARPAPPAADTPTGRSTRPTTPLGVPVGATGGAIAAALAAAGVVATVRRRRRTLLAQRPAGWRLPTLAPDMQQQLGLLDHVAPDDEVLDDLAGLLATLPTEVDPPLLVIHDDGPISLIDVDGELPPPWTYDPGGPDEPARWTARIGERGRRRSIGLPLLLTFGHTGSSTVYANLGALGSLTVDGPADEVAGRLRTLALELATSRLAGPVEVTVCGDDMFAELDQVVTADTPQEAIAATVADTQAGIIDDDRVPRLIVCHTRPDLDLPDGARRFCGLVTAGPARPGSWTLEVDGDRGWLHLPDSRPQPLTLPKLDPTLIADELDRLPVDTPTAHTDEPDIDEPDADNPATDEPDAGEPGGDDPDVEPSGVEVRPRTLDPPYCRVGLLGPVTITRGGTEIPRLSPSAIQVLTYLATHRDGVTLEQLDAAIWPELPPSTGGQRARTALTRLRAALGDDPDGQPLLPRRSQAGDLIGLSGQVGTDLDRCFTLLDDARRADSPHEACDARLAALALIRGQPFTGLTVSWSVDIEQRAITQLQDAALAVASQLTDGGQHDRAVWAIRQALRLCDPTEPLYVAWARIEHARGRPDRIRHLWRRLQRLHADDADEIAGHVVSPATDTERAFNQLLASR